MNDSSHNVIIEEEEEVEQNWNANTEALLRKWAKEAKEISNSHRWKRKVCKCLHLIVLLVTMISSYIFGSSGIILIENENDVLSSPGAEKGISKMQSYVLLVVGVLTTFLKVTELEKRAEKHKKLFKEYGHFYKKIELQLALPISSRKSFISFVTKINRDHQKLMKSS